jgi:hypothetical protein
MGGTLLMPHQNMLKTTFSLRPVDLIVDWQNRTTRVAEDMLDPMTL